MPRGSSRNTSFLLLTTLLWLTAACGPSTPGPGEPALEAEDVASPIEISTEDDIREKPREEGLAGVLPENFPKELPIYLPSSLIDFGPIGSGFYVDLLSPHAGSSVSADLRGRLRRADWRITEQGSGALLLEKNGITAKLTIAGDNPGTRYRYEY